MNEISLDWNKLKQDRNNAASDAVLFQTITAFIDFEQWQFHVDTVLHYHNDQMWLLVNDNNALLRLVVWLKEIVQDCNNGCFPGCKHFHYSVTAVDCQNWKRTVINN